MRHIHPRSRYPMIATCTFVALRACGMTIGSRLCGSQGAPPRDPRLALFVTPRTLSSPLGVTFSSRRAP
eukprot:852692-Prorocentrum_minimum.AAC.1